MTLVLIAITVDCEMCLYKEVNLIFPKYLLKENFSEEYLLLSNSQCLVVCVTFV